MGIKIGVTGKFCCGKDSFANFLVEKKGFKHISLSDILREGLRTEGIEPTRETLQKYGTKLRELEGNAVLAKKTLEKVNETDNYVITSIRNPLEVKELSHSGNFVLVMVDSPDQIRFDRMISRGRKESEPSTLEEFQAAEKKELESDNPSSQQINACLEMAQVNIVNDGTLEEFEELIDSSLKRIQELASFKRPSWDEYFISLINTVGTRGTCNRGRSGCIIVKNKRIITTGYVGSPPGLAHCDEVGHWFKEMVHEDGSISKHCVRTTHAEANAIAQAARYGIGLDGSTLFCKMTPCRDCTKLILSSGIKRVVAEKKYHSAKDSEEMFEEAGITLEVIHDEVEQYEGQTTPGSELPESTDEPDSEMQSVHDENMA